MTKVFDQSAEFVDDMLRGFVAVHKDYVVRVDGGVVRSTVSPTGQVALVIGGGSGHYPAFAGLVGPGLAAGAVCGNIFASPAASQVYRVARACENGGGVLLSYGNYAGDVLHFDKAQEQLRSKGIDTRTVRCTDDIASAPVEEIEKRRGIAGDLTVFKIAGAAAEAGLCLDEVERLAIKANARTRSLGVAFGGCTLPGATQPLFNIPEGRMAVGLGIHGEPGISDLPMASATELAVLLVDALLDDRPADAAQRVAVILNGLGSVKYEELFVLYGRIAPLLESAGLQIVQPECGELVTSLDMSGVSLTLLWLDDELSTLWAAPADSPAYRRGNSVPRAKRNVISTDSDELISGLRAAAEASDASIQLVSRVAGVFESVRQVVLQNAVELGNIDAIAGDGDHGIGMTKGIQAATASMLAASEAGIGIQDALVAAGEQWSDQAGGTSGALWGAALVAIGNRLGNAPMYSDDLAAAAASAALESIVALGKAAVGDKTMVDSLVPYVETLSYQLSRGNALSDALARAAQSATDAAEATSALSPKLGRARPLAERSIGHPDAGAVSLALIVSAIATHEDHSPSGSTP